MDFFPSPKISLIILCILFICDFRYIDIVELVVKWYTVTALSTCRHTIFRYFFADHVLLVANNVKKENIKD